MSSVGARSFALCTTLVVGVSARGTGGAGVGVGRENSNAQQAVLARGTPHRFARARGLRDSAMDRAAGACLRARALRSRCTFEYTSTACDGGWYRMCGIEVKTHQNHYDACDIQYRIL